MMGPMAAGSRPPANYGGPESLLRLKFHVVENQDAMAHAEALYALDSEGTSLATAAVRSFDVCFEDAHEHFCVVSRLRIWGGMSTGSTGK